MLIPAGGVSVRVTLPLLAVLPALVTRMVKLPLPPFWKVPLCVLERVRSGPVTKVWLLP